MKIYIIVTTDGWVPDVWTPTLDKQEALKKAKDYASEWDPENADEEPSGSQLYFSQEEDGNMDQSVTLFERELEDPFLFDLERELSNLSCYAMTNMTQQTLAQRVTEIRDKVRRKLREGGYTGYF